MKSAHAAFALALFLPGSPLVGAALAQSAPTDNRASSCNALCDLFSGISGVFGKSATATPPATNPEPAAEPKKPARHAARGEAPAAKVSRARALSVTASVEDKRLAADVAAALSRKGIPARPASADNLQRVSPVDGDLTILPAPAAANPGSARIIAAKLATDYLLVVAAGDVHSLADLRARNVSFGLNGSASQSIARRIFQAHGIAVKETPLDFANAADALDLGSISAVALLAPKPFDVLKQVVSGKGFHLVSLPTDTTVDGTVVTTLRQADLPNFAADPALTTVSVDVALLARKGALPSDEESKVAAILARPDQRASHVARSAAAPD